MSTESEASSEAYHIYLASSGEALKSELETLLSSAQNKTVKREYTEMLHAVGKLGSLPILEASADFNLRLQTKLQAKPQAKLLWSPRWFGLAITAAVLTVGFILLRPDSQPPEQVTQYLRQMPIHSDEATWGLNTGLPSAIDLSPAALNYPDAQIHSEPFLAL